MLLVSRVIVFLPTAFCSGLVKVNHLFHYIHFDLRCLYLLHIQGSENGQVPNTAGSLFFKVCDVYLPVSADCNLLPLLRLYRLQRVVSLENVIK